MTNKPKQGEALPPGRPTLYKPHMCDIVRSMALLGATEKQMIDTLGIGNQTFAEWKNTIPEFQEAINEGRALADAKVAESLYHRALGYSHPEEKIFNNGGEILRAETIRRYPPDTQAASLWLRNRQPDKWRDTKDISGKLTLSTVLEELEEGDTG